MAVQNIEGMKNILNHYDSRGWAKSAEIDEFSRTEFPQLPRGENPIEKGGGTFGEMLAGSLKDVNELQKDANKAIQKLVSGESKNIHETMLMVEKAEIAFKTMNQIRTKVINAYKEIMRMQI